MKQIIQNFKTGELKVEEVPPPSLRGGGVLVRNVYSVISVGTERSTVGTGQRNIVGKALQRPDLVSAVLDNITKEGLLNTYHKVMQRLDTPKALGYSSAGVILEAAPDVDEFKPGDRVACAGEGYASHAEVIFVPKNLCIPIPSEVNFKEAAFATLGSIAMQGIRQADVAVGDYITVIGLGLVGLLAVQILKACGCHVIGIDVKPDALALASELGADKTISSDDPRVEELVASFGAGYGADCVIITAATSSNRPVELACSILRDRGTIVIVGAVRVDLPRNLCYEKELNVKFSRSYGPGRYDATYEERGIDYPLGYIRWTEKRNMISFLELVAHKKINLERMITHVFPIAEASKAYEIITGRSQEKSLAILLEYGNSLKEPSELELSSYTHFEEKTPATIHKRVKLNIGFIGAGNFAQGYLLPVLKNIREVELQSIANARGISAHSVARKFGFMSSTSNSSEILNDPNIHCIFIATRHNLHAKLVIQALEQNKHVFVEKPLALSEEELRDIVTAYRHSTGQLMVGFNRRFSPLMRQVKEFLHPLQHPLIIHYRINSGFIPKNHWTQEFSEGGGRILGEICHFVDLIQYLTDSVPIKIYAESINSYNSKIMKSDNLNTILKLKDGSLGVITYTSIGNVRLSKERIEIFCDRSSIIVDDFRLAYLYRNRRIKKIKVNGKGHTEEILNFIEAVKEGKSSPIPFSSLVITTRATFDIVKSLNKGLPIYMNYQDEKSGL
jgi:predicted dehydrogenase/threonine dehydrogenase-like Zn-dependent dehydrogenase